MKRIWNWLWRQVFGRGPEPDKWRPPEYDSTGVTIPGLPWDHPLSDPMQDIKDYIEADRKRTRRVGPLFDTEDNVFIGQAKDAIEGAVADANAEIAERGLTERDLMTQGEKELWEDIEGGPPKHEPIHYPPKAPQTTQDWVTEQLQKRTGGITRHPMDKTQYPTPPTAEDLAARDFVNSQMPSGPSARAYFTHGYSMRRLGELLRMAEKREYLTTEELQALRARGLA